MRTRGACAAPIRHTRAYDGGLPGRASFHHHSTSPPVTCSRSIQHPASSRMCAAKRIAARGAVSSMRCGAMPPQIATGLCSLFCHVTRSNVRLMTTKCVNKILDHPELDTGDNSAIFKREYKCACARSHRAFYFNAHSCVSFSLRFSFIYPIQVYIADVGSPNLISEDNS